MPKKKCPLTASGNHQWDDIAESREYDGWYQWCELCGALKSPKGSRGTIFLPLRDELRDEVKNMKLKRS